MSFNSYASNPSDTNAYTFLTIYSGLTGDAILTIGGLSNTATSALIPAGTLEPDTSYVAQLDFTDRIDGTSSGVSTLQGSDVRTTVDFTTSVPEPTTATLLATGSVLLLRRKRRN